ncbi:MAG: NAD(P)/FAD-dependent oxidoreductase [Candidatus Tantalella remota]|nr:NAD(P)/FAD-dependent oxidoreductase [Candidatus Tantalella remota]
MIKYDVLIIGGGVTGAAIARELSQYKLTVGLLEKEEELAFGVSKSNSGIIHPGTQNPPDSLKGRLCVEGNRLVREICKELGVHFKEVGELIVAFNDEETSRLLKLKEEGELLGVPDLKIVDSHWLRKNEPNLNDKAVAALYAPTAGIISPYRLVYDLAENAAKNGVEFHISAKAETIAYSPDEEHRFIVNTPKGAFNARYIINAAGLFADNVSKMVGVDDFTIHPRKGEEFLLDKKREHITKHLLFPLPTKTSKGILVIKTADGNPMIGPTAEDVDDKDDLSTSNEGLAKVLEGVKKMLPTVNENDIIAYFAGLRPASGHDFIIRHEDKVPGFVNVVGIQSPGLTSAPAIALMVLDILKNNGLPLKKKFVFHKHRRRSEHLFEDPVSRIKNLIDMDAAYGDIICRCEMVSEKEVSDAIDRGATTLDGIKFRTRAQAGRCHGGFCTTRLMKILAEKTGKPLTSVTKRGCGSEIVKKDRVDG